MKSRFTERILNQLTMLHGQIVQEITTDKDGYRKWVQVVPPNPLRRGEVLSQPYLVSIFDLQQPAAPQDDWEFEPYMMGDQENIELPSLEMTMTFLIDRGIGLENFTEPWNTDFPF